jgi:hypothetical protein
MKAINMKIKYKRFYRFLYFYPIRFKIPCSKLNFLKILIVETSHPIKNVLSNSALGNLK